MVAGKQMDVVTAGLIVGKRIAARPTPTGFWASLSICARRGHCGSCFSCDGPRSGPKSCLSNEPGETRHP